MSSSTILKTTGEKSSRFGRFVPWLWMAVFGLIGIFSLWKSIDRIGPSTAAAPIATSVVSVPSVVESPPVERPTRYVTKKIRDVETLEWVLADNPEVDGTESEFGEFIPARWRKLCFSMTKPDGGAVEFSLVRPDWWVEFQGAEAGRPIDLDLSELGVYGPTEVVSIGPCPDPGPKPHPGCRLVTGKFTHYVDRMIDVQLDDLDDSVGCTPSHLWWSEDRQAFLPAGELRPGEQLGTADGRPAHVAAITPRFGTQPVYNLEVETEHVYYVSQKGVLVHNTCPGWHHLFPRGLGSEIPRRTNKVLTWMSEFRHTKVHAALDEHLDRFTKTIQEAGKPKKITMNPQRSSGDEVIEHFSMAERYTALEDFYSTYNDGEYYERFMKEVDYMIEKGKWR